MQTLGYPLVVQERIPEITEARNIELGLGLQVAFSCVLYIRGYICEHRCTKTCLLALNYVDPGRWLF